MFHIFGARQFKQNSILYQVLDYALVCSQNGKCDSQPFFCLDPAALKCNMLVLRRRPSCHALLYPILQHLSLPVSLSLSPSVCMALLPLNRKMTLFQSASCLPVCLLACLSLPLSLMRSANLPPPKGVVRKIRI
jgi:hypothetical protein